MKSLPEIDRCPRCGGKAYCGLVVTMAGTTYSGVCGVARCGSEGPGRLTRRGAITAWNRREPSCKDVQIAELEDRIRRLKDGDIAGLRVTLTGHRPNRRRLPKPRH